MALFNIPKRQEQDIHSIFLKAQEEQKPKIKIKGGNTLLTQISAITEEVKRTLGKEAENYLCITSDEEFIEYCKKAVRDGIVAIDTETDSLDSIKANLVGVCMYSPSQKPMYAPVGHISVVTEKKVSPQVSIEAIKEGMKLLQSTKCIFHNSYYDLVILYLATGVMLKVYWDTLVAGHVLNENESHSLKNLYAKYILDNKVEAHYFKDLFQGIIFSYVPYNVGMMYAAKDAIMTYELFRFQEKYLTAGTEECEEYDLSRVGNLYRNDLLPMIPILVDIKLTGMEFDFDKAKELKIKYTKLRDEALVEFNKSLEPFKEAILAYNETHAKILPYPLNYNSSDQLRVLFYDIAKIGVVYRKEPTGTGKNITGAILALDRFKGTPIYTAVKYLVKVREYDKVISSFIDKLTTNATLHNGKIHSNLNLTGTVTGRLSSSEPNQQQVPSKMKDIRQMFYAGKDNVIVGCDFSRQEPCLLASTCKDEKLIQAFHSGLDVYSQIASMVYNVPYEDCLEHYKDGTTNKEGKERRSAAKKIVLSGYYAPYVRNSIRKFREPRNLGCNINN